MASILSIEQVLSLSEVDPTYQAVSLLQSGERDMSHVVVRQLLDRRGPLPALSGDVHVIRDFVNQMSESKKQMTPDDILEADVSIPTRDGQRIHARHYRPKIAPKDGSALVVMFHGGGNILGSYLQEEAKCRNFTQRYGCVCLNVDYRLAPEVTFPVPVQDCHDAVKWAAELAEKLGSRPVQGFIIGGTSAGANMADAVAHLCRDEKLLPTLTGELLLIPELLGEEVVPEKWRPMYLSWEQNKMADGLTRESIKYYEGMVFFLESFKQP